MAFSKDSGIEAQKAKPEAGHPVNTQAERAMRAALNQGACWALMFGVGENALALLAAHLQAPAVLFGYLTGIPQLLGPLLQIFAARLCDLSFRRGPLVLAAVLVQASSFMPLAWLALAGPGPYSTGLFLVFAIIFYLAGHFMTPPWTSLIGEWVPEQRRSDFFARKLRLVSAISLIAQGGMAAALYFGRAFNGLAWVLAGGMALSGLARMGSWIFIRRIPDMKRPLGLDERFTFWQFIRRVRESNFVRFVCFVALLHFGVMISGPFFLPYWIYGLGYQEWQWMVLSGMAGLASVLTLLFWGSFSNRFGNKNTLLVTGYGIAIVPLFWLCTDSFYLLAGWNAVSGVAWAGFGLASWNYLLEAVSPSKRARCSAYYSLVLGVCVFLGAMVGGLITKVVPLNLNLGRWHFSVRESFTYLLLSSFVIRLLACLLLLSTFRELRAVEPFSPVERLVEVFQGRVPFGLRVRMVHQPSKREDAGQGP